MRAFTKMTTDLKAVVVDAQAAQERAEDAILQAHEAKSMALVHEKRAKRIIEALQPFSG